MMKDNEVSWTQLGTMFLAKLKAELKYMEDLLAKAKHYRIEVKVTKKDEVR